jgi:hypothetical protein
MKADNGIVFFFQANGGLIKHTSLATSRIMIRGAVEHFTQSIDLIVFIFNAGDCRMKICPRSERK